MYSRASAIIFGVTRQPRKCGGAGEKWTCGGGGALVEDEDDDEDRGDRAGSDSGRLPVVVAVLLRSVSVLTCSLASVEPAVTSSMMDDEGGENRLLIVVTADFLGLSLR